MEEDLTRKNRVCKGPRERCQQHENSVSVEEALGRLGLREIGENTRHVKDTIQALGLLLTHGISQIIRRKQTSVSSYVVGARPLRGRMGRMGLGEILPCEHARPGLTSSSFFPFFTQSPANSNQSTHTWDGETRLNPVKKESHFSVVSSPAFPSGNSEVFLSQSQTDYYQISLTLEISTHELVINRWGS